MASASHSPQTSADELLYLRAHAAWALLMVGMAFFEVPFPGGASELYMYVTLLVIVFATTIALFIGSRRASGSVASAMMWTLGPDLLAISGFTYLFHGIEDGFYPVAMLLPVAYALVVRKREAWMVGAATCIAYATGHVLGHALGVTEFVIFAFKTVAIPIVAIMVASSVDKQRRHEEATLAAVAEKDSVNLQMQRRISELQAVSEITELIHSSLDFDRVGPLVLEILAKVIGVESCCMFVIDKVKSETLFQSSAGAPVALPHVNDPLELQYADIESHYSCASVFDHSDTMVLFCAAAEDFERMTHEDRLVLGAIASELVVALENSRLYKLTKTLAVTDELTGLANYRSLQQRLDAEIERARRYDKKLSLLMLDADDFKAFNDTYGHIAGDIALAEIGQVLTTVVREVDLVARYGGEEFSVVLPETDAAGAFVAAEKIREAVAEHLFTGADPDEVCTLTVSIGLATYPSHAWDKESLLREADDALYTAKNGGKNRVKTPHRRSTHTGSRALPDATSRDAAGRLSDTDTAQEAQADDAWADTDQEV